MPIKINISLGNSISDWNKEDTSLSIIMAINLAIFYQL